MAKPSWFVLSLTGGHRMCPGCYIFKVAYERQAWVRLAVPADATLDDLAMAVLKAFRFSDTDHLYEFRFQDQFGKSRMYYHPYTDDGPYGDEISIGETSLPVGQTMRFIFDFGDQWRFALRLERIDPADGQPAVPVVIDAAGEPPKQFPDWN